MPFVKLDTGILNSTLWVDRDVTQIFITALLMAEPFEIRVPMEQLEVRCLESTGFIVPPGWYGLVPAAGVGIIRRALMEQEPGYRALEKLGSAETESRSINFEGRRLVRVEGGYIVLNYMKYRDKDHTAAERQKRMRERRKQAVTPVTLRDIPVTSHIADADSREHISASPSESPEFSLTEGVSKSPERVVDPRHAAFRKRLEKFWAWKNPNLPKFSWGAADAKQLSSFLKRWKDLTKEEFDSWLMNYARSDDITPSKTPQQFLPRLHDYASGPRNEFHNPKREKKSVL